MRIATEQGSGTVDENSYANEVPGINGGYPLVRGSRIPVRVVVEIFRKTHDLERLVEMYPHIGRERLHGALDYYAAHPDRVDEDIERNARALAEHEGRLWPA
jgi:uncharacterized protein (DUF433 family)